MEKDIAAESPFFNAAINEPTFPLRIHLSIIFSGNELAWYGKGFPAAQRC